ncbi:uncharacterized protein C3orf20 homolog isoform X2 [Ascaphus truei]|uniref:uncharacterized protein C3orf20 homolog isoform X2 n=1 Tax=Ascaphus truei TaxID=8439 RepID=UPI003F59F286
MLQRRSSPAIIILLQRHSRDPPPALIFSRRLPLTTASQMDLPQKLITDIEKNTAFEDMKIAAPSILSELTQLLKYSRQHDFRLLNGVKNIFDFSREELKVPPHRKTNIVFPKAQLKFNIDPTPMPSPPESDKRGKNKKTTPVQSRQTQVWNTSQSELSKYRRKFKRILRELQRLEIKKATSLFCDHSEAFKRLMDANLTLFKQKQVTEQTNKGHSNKGKRGSADPSQRSHPTIILSTSLMLLQQLSGTCLKCALVRGNKLSAFMALSDQMTSGPSQWTKDKLQEVMQIIKQEAAAALSRGHTKPLLFQYYAKKISKVSTPGAPPSGSDTKSTGSTQKKTRVPKLCCALPDGSMCIYYPSGHLAMCQLTFFMGISRSFLYLFEDAPSLAFLASFVSDGMGCVYYNEPSCCSIALIMDTLGGLIRDINGYVVYTWDWTATALPPRTFVFKISEHLTLQVFSQTSVSVVFNCQEDTITVPLRSPSPTVHQPVTRKSMVFQLNEEAEKREPLHRAMLDLKKQFWHSIKQFTKTVHLAAVRKFPSPWHGQHTLSPPGVTHTRAATKSPTEFTAVTPKVMTPKALSPGPHGGPAAQLLEWKQPKTTLRAKPFVSAEEQLSSTISDDTCPPPAVHCPVVLRRWLSGVLSDSECRCFLTIPSVTDLELDVFVRAPRELPHQILVLGVVSSQNPKRSAFLENILEELYSQRKNRGRSPCLQCKLDPYRFLKYDVDSSLAPGAALLVERNCAAPGFTLMYTRGRLIFGGSILNGYGCTKKDLLQQIRQAARDGRAGRFLPDNFKFSQADPQRPQTARQSSRGRPFDKQTAPEDERAPGKHLRRRSLTPTEKPSRPDSALHFVMMALSDQDCLLSIDRRKTRRLSAVPEDQSLNS